MSVTRLLPSGSGRNHPVTGIGLRTHPTLESTRIMAVGVGEDKKSEQGMVNLHQQLQKEADQIVKWKAAMEVHTKNLEQQLEEARGVMEDHRHKLKELQLHSEHLSQALINERQERELHLDKVTHTRQMYLTLKDQHEHLSETVSHFQEIRNEYSAEQQSHISQLGDLNENCSAYVSQLENLNAQREENMCIMESLKEEYNVKMTSKKVELLELEEKVVMKREEYQSVAKRLGSIEAELAAVLHQNTELTSHVEDAERELLRAREDLREAIDSLTSMAEKVEMELRLEGVRLKESQKEFHEAAEQILFLKKGNDRLEGANSELSDKVTALLSRKQELEEESVQLSNALALLEANHADLLLQVGQAQARVSELSSQLADLEITCRDLEVNRVEALRELDGCKLSKTAEAERFQKLESQVTTLKEEILIQQQSQAELREAEAINEKLIHELEILTKQQDKDLMKMKERLNQLHTNASDAENCKIQVDDQLKALQSDSNKLSVELQLKKQEYKGLLKETKNVKSQVKKLEKEVKLKVKKDLNENKANKKMEETIASLESELEAKIQETKTWPQNAYEQEKQLEEKKHAVEVCQDKMKESVNENQQLSSLIKSSDEDLATLRAEMQREQDDLRAEVISKEATLKESVEMHTLMISKLQEELKQAQRSEEIAQLNQQHQVELENLRNLEKETLSEKTLAKSELETATKETQRTKLECDGKVKEMMSLLEKYNSDKDISLKENKEQREARQAQVAELTLEKAVLQKEVEVLKAEVMEAREKPTPVKMLEEFSLKTSISPCKNTFVEPLVPKTPRTPCVAQSQDSHLSKSPLLTKPPETKNEGFKVTSILKLDGRMKRTLLPPKQQKHVIFKIPSLQSNSVDSSSDAMALEVTDSDDGFEIKRSAPARATKIPKANIAPFTHTTSTDKDASVTSVREKKTDRFHFFLHAGGKVHGKRKKDRKGLHQRKKLREESTIDPKASTRHNPCLKT
ncbi:hypothetical protein Pmani_021618 [Petrolisthes manimaculis]|uniref:Synaptonemal complex protein 1 n=1 Tax=Petrolisthes manimaculis TaxID=1843537 RepID=A0AAE1PDS9_9EUCA|nr:hypothetical protein Pmani_021618 [Petrolisthes manimaculis]